MPMTRGDLQHLAAMRLREGQALYGAAEWSGAYYITGYSMECGLKACIARQVNEYDFPDRKAVELSYTHNLPQLLGVCGDLLAPPITSSGGVDS